MTRENAIKVLKNLKEYYNDEDEDHNYIGFDKLDNMAIDTAIKALEQETLLDKVRAEILAMMPPLGKWMYEEGHMKEQTACEVIADVVQIIDKYKAESEDKEWQ